MDITYYIERQKAWSLQTFGEGKRTDGISQHIRHELDEIAEAPDEEEKLRECVDVLILTLDMMWRLGFEPDYIEYVLNVKQEINIARKWPPKEVSEANQDKPTFHIKE